MTIKGAAPAQESEEERSAIEEADASQKAKEEPLPDPSAASASTDAASTDAAPDVMAAGYWRNLFVATSATSAVSEHGSVLAYVEQLEARTRPGFVPAAAAVDVVPDPAQAVRFPIRRRLLQRHETPE